MNPYATGFCDRCRERGIDPAELVKTAQEQDWTGALALPDIGKFLMNPIAGYTGAKARKLIRFLQQFGMMPDAMGKDRTGRRFVGSAPQGPGITYY